MLETDATPYLPYEPHSVELSGSRKIDMSSSESLVQRTTIVKLQLVGVHHPTP